MELEGLVNEFRMVEWKEVGKECSSGEEEIWRNMEDWRIKVVRTVVWDKWGEGGSTGI